MKILVTGANGTIGTRLCEKLVDQGHEVCGMDIRKNKFENLGFVEEVDILDKKHLFNSFKENEFDCCIHLAANPYVRKSVADPDLAFENVQMVYNVLEYCRMKGINKIFLASSREIYGNQNKIKKSEEDVFLNGCESPYTASKFYLEALGQAYRNSYDMHVTILRFSNVYGMYDDSDRLVPTMIKKILDDEELEIYGEDKSLDFTYIDDTVQAVIQLLEADLESGEVFNVSSGKQTSLINIAEILKSIMGKPNIKVNVTRSFKGEVHQYVGDIRKLKEHIDFVPKFDILRGLANSVDFYVRYFNNGTNDR